MMRDPKTNAPRNARLKQCHGRSCEFAVACIEDGVKRLTYLSLLFFAWFVCDGIYQTSRAVELTRGPYLQSATSTSIVLRWRTDLPADSQVQYGSETNKLSFTASEPTPGTNHVVLVSGLSAATEYFYSVGSATQTLVMGPEYRFVTAPPPGTATPTRIWVIGDSGGLSIGITNVLNVRDAFNRYSAGRKADVWIVLGDMAYGSGTDEEFQADFFEPFNDMVQQNAPWPTIGNHETYCAPAGDPFPYLDIFSLPANGEVGGTPSGTEHYYSFDYANIHFICLDSMTEARTTNGPMAAWLRDDLAATTNEWKIAFWHHPPYTKGTHDSDAAAEFEMIEMRQNILPILEDGVVDLVLNGHSHNYERSYLLRGHYGFSTNLAPEMILDSGSGDCGDTGAYVKPTSSALSDQGTVYVVAGNGCICEARFGHHPAMFTEASQVGSLVLDVVSNRLDARFLAQTGAVSDSFSIIKGAPEPLRLCPCVVGQGTIITRWKSIRGQNYRVEFTKDLRAQNWQPISDPIVASGATSSFTNELSLAGAGFYRVVQPNP
jgi:acid phosphatase type 7